MCGVQKLIIGESPYPGNKHYEPLTLTLDELKCGFKNYLKVISNSNNSIDELDAPEELVVAFVPKLLVKKNLHELVSFRRVICMIYGPKKAQDYISDLDNEIKEIKSRGKKKKKDLENISKKIAKKLHDDGIVLLNVLEAPPSPNDSCSSLEYISYLNNLFEHCNSNRNVSVLLLGQHTMGAWDNWVEEPIERNDDVRSDILKYYHPSGRVRGNEGKWKGIDYKNESQFSTLEEVKGFKL